MLNNTHDQQYRANPHHKSDKLICHIINSSYYVVANHMPIHHGLSYEIIPTTLGIHKVSSRLVPKQITKGHKYKQFDNLSILDCYQGDAFLKKINH